MASAELPRGSRPLPLRERRQSAALGRASLLVVTVPMLWVSVAWLQRTAPLVDADLRWTLILAATSSLLFALGALFAVLGRKLAGPLAVAGFAAGSAPLAYSATGAPDVAFLSLAWGVAATYLACSQPSPPGRFVVPSREHLRAVFSPALLSSGGCALGLAALAAGHRLLERPTGLLAVLALLAVPSMIASVAEWLFVRHGALERWKAAALWGLTAAGLGLVLTSPLALLLLGARLLLSLGLAARGHELYPAALRFFWRRPALLVVATFVTLGFAGGIVLTFPACTTHRIPDLDALFTSVSASCVTGLVVLDTPADFTFVGQLIILGLIQVGGLGIMTLSAVSMLIFGGALPSEEESALGEIVGAGTPRATVRLVKLIVASTLAIETAGTLLLFPGFLAEGYGPLEALWKATFHSVSAFCNAGFALQSSSLVEYQENPYILEVVATLILLGGIGFGVLVALFDRLRRGRHRVSLHAKLVLTTTLFCLLTGFVLFLALEWNASLAGQGLGTKLQNAWFHSVTPRTAGFNSVPLDLVRPATVLLMMALMLVGASPISTGGGVKTTTAAVLLLAVRATATRRGNPQAFGRQIPSSVVYRAAAVLTLSLSAVVLGAMVLLATQSGPFDHLLFESISAFGTVGLSLGATTTLDSVGKVVIICLMLVGRTGPLTLVLLFAEGRPGRLRYPEEEVLVG